MTIERKPELRKVLGINFRFTAAVVFLGYGWLMWQWTSKEWWGLGIAAFLALLGGGIGFVGTLYQVFKLAARDRKLQRFTAHHRTARGDLLASERDLKKHGSVR